MGYPNFITPVDLEPQDDDIHWKVISPVVYESKVPGVGRITVPVGFLTDLSSVPRLPFIYWWVGGRDTKGSVLHDYLYQTQLATQKQADDVFYEAGCLTGVPKWAAFGMWLGLRLAGHIAYDNYTKRGK